MRIEVAVGADDAAIAERARLADAAAVQDERVRRSRPVRGGHGRAQLLLDDLGIVGPGDADPVGDAQDVAIDGKPGTPSACPRTTLAVLRPTPGSATSASIVRGTSPPCVSTTSVAMPRSERDFARKNPVDWICGSSSPVVARASARASG